MKQLSKKLTMALGLSLISACVFSTQTIYGLQKASHFHSRASGNFYIQVASFKNKSNALQHKSYLRNKTGKPVFLKEKQGYYTVIVGPVHSAKAVRSIAQALPETSIKQAKSQQLIHSDSLHVPVKQKNNPVQNSFSTEYKDKDGFLLSPSNRWYVGLGGGWMSPFGTNKMNYAYSGMPGFPDDRYSAEGSDSAGQYSVLAGYQWRGDTLWLPAYSLGLQYTYTDSAGVNGFIFVNDLPDSQNFTYKYDVSQHILLAKAKVDLYRWKQIMPYVTAGAGVSFNKGHNYSDQPIPGATLMQRRYGFTSDTQPQFAGVLGAGLDYEVNDKIQLSLGYELSYYGHVNTGKGEGVLSGNSLENDFNSNAVVLHGVYFFDR